MIRRKTIETLYMMLILAVLAVYGCVAMLDGDNTAGMESGLMPFAVVGVVGVLIPYLLFASNSLLRKKDGINILKTWMWYYIYSPCVVFFTLGYNVNFKGGVYAILGALLPFLIMLVFYLYIYRNGLSAFFLTACGLMALVLLLQYMRLYSLANQVDSAHIGIVYHFLFLLPLLLLHPSKIMRYVMVFVVMFVMFSSMKRGGVLAFAVGMLIYLLVKSHVQAKNKFIGLLILLFSLLLLGGTFWWLGTSGDNYVFERFMNIQKDEGSGRVDVWTTTWSMILRSDIVSFLMGHGYNAVLKDSPLYLSAHNDWLEVWYDYGLIGVLLLALAMISWLRFALHLYKQKSPIAASCFMLGVVVGVLTMISHVIIYPWMAWVCLCLGVFVGEVDRKKILHE